MADKYSLWTNDTAANLGLFGVGDGTATMVLPNWSDRMAQFAATAGGTVAAGLPNVTGGLMPSGVSGGFDTNSATGAFYSIPVTSGPISASGTSTLTKINFDASKSNAIYGASTTVQPPAINLLAVMRY